MKQFNTLALLTCFLVVGLFSCQKELNFPEAPPVSQFTIEADGKTYYLNIDHQSIKLGDTAELVMRASAPEFSVRFNFMSATHQNGMGTYSVKCCTNNIFDRTTGTERRWEIDQRGTTRGGTLNIIKMNEKGYEGSYTIYSNDYDISGTAKKEFKGTFVVVY